MAPKKQSKSLKAIACSNNTTNEYQDEKFTSGSPKHKRHKLTNSSVDDVSRIMNSSPNRILSSSKSSPAWNFSPNRITNSFNMNGSKSILNSSPDKRSITNPNTPPSSIPVSHRGVLKRKTSHQSSSLSKSPPLSQGRRSKKIRDDTNNFLSNDKFNEF